MIPVRVLGTGSYVAGSAVSTDEVLRRAMPSRDARAIQEAIGISTRFWVSPETTAAELGAEALRRALQAAEVDPRDLRRVIFVSSTGGDWLVPATANAVMAELGLAEHCGCLDVNNACTGYLTAFDLGARLVATGEAPVAVVASEIFSRHIAPRVPRSYVVMADAAGAMVLGPGRPGDALLAVDFGNDGTWLDAVTLKHGGLTGQHEAMGFGRTSAAIGENALRDMLVSARAVLAATGLTTDDVSWVIPHQPNGPMLRSFFDALGIGMDRTIPLVDEIGSVGAASVAVGLDRLYRSGRLEAGHRVMLLAVGAGSSRGAVLYEVGR